MTTDSPEISEEAATAAAFEAEREGLLSHFGCNDECSKRAYEIEALTNVLAAAYPHLVGPLLERLDQQTAEIERLNQARDKMGVEHAAMFAEFSAVLREKRDLQDRLDLMHGRPGPAGQWVATSELAAAQARAGELEYQLATIRDRAGNEIADAKEGEAYHAEINSGLGLVAEQSRRSAWETVERLAGDAALR